MKPAPRIATALIIAIAVVMAGCTTQPATTRPAMPITLTCQPAACHSDGTHEHQCK